jgi:hypothetical protein
VRTLRKFLVKYECHLVNNLPLAFSRDLERGIVIKYCSKSLLYSYKEGERKREQENGKFIAVSVDRYEMRIPQTFATLLPLSCIYRISDQKGCCFH